MNASTHALSPETRQKIDEWLKRYPEDRKQSGVMEALRLVQEQNQGHLTKELMKAVADYLDIPAVSVYEVATFYTMYEHEPVGKHVLQLCTNVSCMLSGSEKIAEHLKNKLGIDFNQTTPDGVFTLKEVECLGACVAAPVLQHNQHYCERVTEASIDGLIAECRSACGGKKHE